MPAFQFYARPDGLALTTQGLVYSWIGSTTVPIYQYLTPIGLLTQGLVIGEGDFWHYGESIGIAGWTRADL